ncbi:hypothetical protein J3A83DRAFT_4248443 [Scleroderma citrinum]
MQVPSNIFLDRLTRPSAYLSLAALLWGLFSVSTGFAWRSVVSELVFYRAVYLDA